ncbi:hypothetical protein NIES37_24430 [Tolypothrix tenuis PCC 7101]|uniref:Uncharacterized protein n=1 Tax=Tolypothrix tenuis PCC 7101 TaxID=231146 RepID=A0A1Z4MYH4_9CYAN|nr:hypothetical protein NIES37_24430 [Tolypothrix tenuis PCC 7101]BAZ77588.1 hypothetical protein NIES50_62190 [Aulosira laxa NIES-50]
MLLLHIQGPKVAKHGLRREFSLVGIMAAIADLEILTCPQHFNERLTEQFLKQINVA